MAPSKVCVWMFNGMNHIGNDEKRVFYRCSVCGAENSSLIDKELDPLDYKPQAVPTTVCSNYKRPVQVARRRRR